MLLVTCAKSGPIGPSFHKHGKPVAGLTPGRTGIAAAAVEQSAKVTDLAGGGVDAKVVAAIVGAAWGTLLAVDAVSTSQEGRNGNSVAEQHASDLLRVIHDTCSNTAQPGQPAVAAAGGLLAAVAGALATLRPTCPGVDKGSSDSGIRACSSASDSFVDSGNKLSPAQTLKLLKAMEDAAKPRNSDTLLLSRIGGGKFHLQAGTEVQSYDLGSIASIWSDSKGEGTELCPLDTAAEGSTVLSEHCTQHSGQRSADCNYVVTLKKCASNCTPPDVYDPRNPEGVAAYLQKATSAGSLFRVVSDLVLQLATVRPAGDKGGTFVSMLAAERAAAAPLEPNHMAACIALTVQDGLTVEYSIILAAVAGASFHKYLKKNPHTVRALEVRGSYKQP